MNRDLIALVADIQQEKTLETLLHERQQALHIRPITFDIRRHPGKDPGVYKEAAKFLQSHATSYTHALVLLDHAWQGVPGDAQTVAQTIRENLHRTGWMAATCEVIVIEPELEAWVWSTSPAVLQELDMTWEQVMALAQQYNSWDAGQPKPHAPKELLEAILRQQRRPRSAAIFQAPARKVSLTRCQDQAVALLRETLAQWFPQP